MPGLSPRLLRLPSLVSEAGLLGALGLLGLLVVLWLLAPSLPSVLVLLGRRALRLLVWGSGLWPVLLGLSGRLTRCEMVGLAYLVSVGSPDAVLLPGLPSPAEVPLLTGTFPFVALNRLFLARPLCPVGAARLVEILPDRVGRRPGLLVVFRPSRFVVFG